LEGGSKQRRGESRELGQPNFTHLLMRHPFGEEMKNNSRGGEKRVNC
jgi:hypothetical protein